MAEYSREDLVRMQQQAARRVQQMNERARRSLERTPAGHRPAVPEFEVAAPEPKETPVESVPKQGRLPSSASCGGSVGGAARFFNLRQIFQDADAPILLAVLLLLTTEKEDPLLLMALVYIML